MSASVKTKKSSRRLDASTVVRNGVRDRLSSEFNDFLDDATEEEKWFLFDVFMTRVSRYFTHEPNVAIASAFEDCIHRQGEYLCLKDEKLRSAVDRFIHDYKECEGNGKFEAAAHGWRLWKGSLQVNDIAGRVPDGVQKGVVR